MEGIVWVCKDCSGGELCFLASGVGEKGITTGSRGSFAVRSMWLSLLILLMETLRPKSKGKAGMTELANCTASRDLLAFLNLSSMTSWRNPMNKKGTGDKRSEEIMFKVRCLGPFALRE
jgi:hypothetical protein